VTTEVEGRPGRERRLGGALLRVLIGAALLAVVVSTIDLKTTLAKAQGANIWIVLFAVAGLTGIQVIGAVAWREIARLLIGVRFPWRTALGSYYVAQALGGLTPANVGGDAYRVYTHREAGQDWSNAALPVLVQRGTSFLGLAGLGTAGLLLLPSAAGIGAPLLVGGVVLAVVLGIPVGLLLRRRTIPLTGLPRPALPRALAVGLGLALVFHAAAIVLSYLLVVAVEPGAGSLAVIGAIAIARLAIAIPLSPSGIGFQEGALALMFVSLGLRAETAVAASLLGRLSLLSTGAVGAAVVVSRGRQPR
jgi:uncharacterized membrane protein YbhN (UPF0104 family)